ncbi:DOCK3 [Acanthosepion pharaonis]|uniref:DOCK3 n=1 Tax=Acanthosepion pharaonis TaxID=158019 RepID=A0A812CP24_ACAPH|nr:DOCK3 [Sepia pharaonis]
MSISCCDLPETTSKQKPKSTFYLPKRSLFKNQKEIWKELHSIMQDLIAMRRTLLADTYTQDQKQDLKMKIAQKIDWGNKNLSLDLVPRLNGEQVDADKISIVQLYRIHKDSENYMVRRKVHGSDHLSNEFKSLSITNLLVNFKSFPCSVNEDLELYFSIYDAKDSKFISERFLVKLTHQGMPKTMEKLNNCYGLFTDLSSNDMEKDLWLVIQIYRIGKMLINETSKKAMNQKFKRPYGVAACSFRDINQSSFIHEEKEISLKVTSCVDKEELFINLHENIIKKASPRFSSSSEKANLVFIVFLFFFFFFFFFESTSFSYLYPCLFLLSLSFFLSVIPPFLFSLFFPYLSLYYLFSISSLPSFPHFSSLSPPSSPSLFAHLHSFVSPFSHLHFCYLSFLSLFFTFITEFLLFSFPYLFFHNLSFLSLFYHFYPLTLSFTSILVSPLLTPSILPSFPLLSLLPSFSHISSLFHTYILSLSLLLLSFFFYPFPLSLFIFIYYAFPLLLSLFVSCYPLLYLLTFSCPNYFSPLHESFVSPPCYSYFLEFSYGSSCLRSSKQTTFLYGQIPIRLTTKGAGYLFPICLFFVEYYSGLHIGLQIMFGDLMSLKAVHPVLFNKGVDLVQKCMFPESLLPGEVRNDLYIVLNCGDFERGNKKAAKNVEVEMTAFDSDGNIIHDCIYGGISEPPTTSYLSTVFYHNNNPRWMETIKFCLPIEKFTGAHIRLDLRHCSTRDKGEKKLFGFTFLKITSSDITLMDNAHTLCIYKCDSLSQLKNSSYINLPCTTSELNNPISSALQTGGPHFQRSAREYIEVTSCLCSTKFTQNRDLLEILQWRTKRHKISSSLEKLASIQDIDIVRYLHDILDTLFDMFISDSAQPVSYAQNVFEALIHVFHLLTERKFKHYVPGFQSYLYETFSSSLVYRDLLFCLGQSITKVIDGSTDKILKQMFKVFDYLFQFIVQSNVLFVRTYTSSDAIDFSELIGNAFKKMGKLVSLSNPSLHSSQVLLLTHLPSIYHSLLKLVSCQVITQHVANIVNEMPKELSESLLNAKLQLLHDTVNTELIADKESRRILLNLCMSQIKRCFIHKKALQLAITVLEDILKYLYTLKMGSLVSCLVEMLRLMDDQHYTSLFQAYTNKAPLKDFLVRVLLTFLELIKPGNFPSDWSVMRMVMNNVILTSIHYFARALSDHFLQADDFDYQLWNNYFNLAVAFITQPSLQLENFSVAKRQKIKERYQDMRVLLGFQMQTLWQELGQHKLCFIPCMIGPFLEVTLVPETELRKATLPILYDMMECEQKIPEELKTVENEIIEKLDIFITDDKGDTEYKELFHDILLEKVQAEPTLRENGTYFIQSVTDLLERLLDYRKFIDKEENRDKRMQCTYNILNFYHTGIKKEEMYIRYINKLYELHLSTDSYVEAGLTLRLYSELLDWNDSILASEMRYHAQQEWERKEKLYLEIIDCFDRGKVWEYGIPLCKELASLYESKLYNYQELSKILQKEAKFFENILEGPFLRQDPCYYRVAYYGNSFPKFVQNKVFVYRGDECLKLQTIMTHLTTEYPLATILNHNNPPDDLMKQGEQQYIQISCVKPVENQRVELDNSNVPREIKFFYQVNEVDTFLFDRPYHRGDRDKNNEFKTLCIERSILKTTHKLPGILRWYEVDNVNVQFLTPIEVAIDMMKQATKDLIIQTEKCRISPKTEIPFLSLKLNGMISACVNGGVAKYQEAFFSPEYSSKYSSELHFLEELKNVMMEQMHALEASLELHGKETNEEMQPLHKQMEDQLCITKRDILQLSKMQLKRLLIKYPPHRHEQAEDRPGTPSTGSVHSNSSNRSSTLSTDTGFHDEDNPSNYYSDVKERADGAQYPHLHPRVGITI